MKKRLLILLAIVGLFLLTGCDFSKKDDSEIIKQGYTVIVTFDANGGMIGNYQKRQFYFKENSLIVEPSASNCQATASKQGFILDGWYYGDKDDEGNVTLTTKFNFETDRVTESITLYALWKNYFTTTICYGENFSQTQVVSKVETADTIVDMPTTAPTWSGYTFLDYYADEALTVKFDWSSTDNYDENQNRNVYCKFLTGRWIIASKATDLAKINTATNVYVVNDIDCTGVTTQMPLTYSGKFIGNGYTISNMTVTYKQSGLSDTTFALFKKLDGATITDVTFDNVTISATVGVGSSLKAGVFAGVIKSSTVTNVKVKNSTITLTLDGLAQSAFKTGIYYAECDSASSVTGQSEENNEIIFN